MKRNSRPSYVYRPGDLEIKRRLEDGGLSVNGAITLLRQAEQEACQAPLPPLNEIELQSLMKEIDELIGLQKVKGLIKEIRAFVEISQLRRQHQLKSDGLVLHMVFKGNPGTGKTTMARILGRLLCELHVLPKGHLIEVERADLVGEYIGHTAQKTREQVKKAMGGILFIDEAYSLARGGDKDFGKEAIDTLVKAMEDYKNQFILILAGYRLEMEHFIRSNPGLCSRFPIQIHFPDYNCEELQDIALLMLRERQYRLTPEALEYLSDYLKTKSGEKSVNFSNARLVRNIIERAIRRQALRLVGRNSCSRDELMLIGSEDLIPGEGDGGEEWFSPW